MTNDRFDPLRPGSKAVDRGAGRGRLGAARTPADPGPPRPSFRRPASTRPEGRWSRLVAGRPRRRRRGRPRSPGRAALLDRYGVLTRETLALDPWAPPWRDLAACLARAELRGEVRRGYFVEGLSGVQYATAEAADALAERAAGGRGRTPRS